jgi:cell division protein FtsQ
VVSRPHLALVPANGLGGRLRAPSVRVLAIVAIVVAVVVLGYAVARFTSLFALEGIEIEGGTRAARADVREAGEPFLGASLVSLDQDELRQELLALPTVRSVRIDRAFPHTLRVSVVPERPLAVIRSGSEAWLVSERHRVIRSVKPESVGRPVVWTLPGTALEPGRIVQGENTGLALEALRRLPDKFPVKVDSARASGGEITLILAGGAELRLGRADAVALKLAVAARVLRTLSASERAGITYLDVSVPERAVTG